MLSCGHTIPLRDSPRSERAKYGCRAGKGCGYTLWWVEEWSVKNPEKRNVNRLYRENEERAKAE
jgi:hypothetical protein